MKTAETVIEKLPEGPGSDDLAALAGVAASADALGAPPTAPTADGQPPAGGAPPAVDYAAEATGAVDMFATMVTAYCPTTEPLWDADSRTRVSAALAPVMAKYNFSFGNLPPELTFAIVAGPLLFQTSKLVAAQMAAKKAESAARKGPAAPPPPAGGNVGQGAEVGVHPQVKLYEK